MSTTTNTGSDSGADPASPRTASATGPTAHRPDGFATAAGRLLRALASAARYARLRARATSTPRPSDVPFGAGAGVDPDRLVTCLGWLPGDEACGEDIEEAGASVEGTDALLAADGWPVLADGTRGRPDLPLATPVSYDPTLEGAADIAPALLALYGPAGDLRPLPLDVDGRPGIVATALDGGVAVVRFDLVEDRISVLRALVLASEERLAQATAFLTPAP